MRNRALTTCLIVFLAVSALGCIDHEGQLALMLTSTNAAAASAALAVRQVSVTITSVEVFASEGGAFVNLAAGPQQYELLGMEGRSSLLALANEIEEGNYTQVRLTFSSDSHVINAAGRRHDLSIEPTVVTVPGGFRVVEDGSTEVVIDMDVTASLTQKGNGTWILRPVMRQLGAETTIP